MGRMVVSTVVIHKAIVSSKHLVRSQSSIYRTHKYTSKELVLDPLSLKLKPFPANDW